jgi:hypothetical protein
MQLQLVGLGITPDLTRNGLRSAQVGKPALPSGEQLGIVVNFPAQPVIM